jgi:hypothetical protein
MPGGLWPERAAAACLPAVQQDPMGRALIILGLVIAAIGVLVSLGVPFGRLPGDFVVRRGSFTFYFPLATSILLSVLLTILLSLLRR